MIELTDSIAVFRRKVMQELVNELNSRISLKKDLIVQDVKAELRVFFYNSRHYDSMVSGTDDNSLRAHFGFINGESKAGPIIEKFISGIHAAFTPYNSSFGGNFSILGIKDDFLDVLSLSSAYVNNKGKLLPWLKWLLEEGDSFVIDDADIVFGPYPQSRSGLAIMRGPGKWKVPAEYSGTKDDNWATEVIDQLYQSRVLEQILRKHIDAR